MVKGRHMDQKGRKGEGEAVLRSGSLLPPSCGALTPGGNANARPRPGARVGADQLVASRPQPGNSTRRICLHELPALRPFPPHRGTHGQLYLRIPASVTRA